ncbi:MAG TPA: murein biosynthesis integral membrane protein MurJ [Acidimicrobiales bacterium]|nr:murein biosynthesis integral membrane protein MurJ [Acidimicrobiales bacterium]
MRRTATPVRDGGEPSPPEGGHPPVARSTAVMAGGTLLSRVTGFGRLAALAYAVGFTRLTDSYNLANVTPNIVYELVLGGVLSATLVPVFVDRATRDQDDDEAWRSISAVISAAAVLLVAVTAIFFVLAPVLIQLYTVGSHGSSVAQERAVATSFLRFFAPQVAFYGLVTIVTAVLQARRRFAAPMFAPVLNNLIVIGVLLAIPHVVHDVSLDGFSHDTGARLLLGLGTTAGVAAMALALLPPLKRSGARIRWVWDPRNEAVRTIVRLSGWTFGFVAANQVALLLVLVLANRHSGDVAAYQAAQVFFLLPHGVFAVSVMTALQPELAERWSAGGVVAFGRRVSSGLRTIAVVVIPASVGYLCLARPLVSVALEHGALASASADTTAGVLACLAVGLPGFSSYLFLTRAYQAMQDTRSVFWLYLLENGLNVVLAVLLYPVLGVQGLGLAYGLAYMGAAVVALILLQRRTGTVDIHGVVRAWVRIGFASAVMAAVVLALAAVVQPALPRAASGVAAGVAVYVLVARRLGIHEVSNVLRMRRRTP